MLRLIQLWKKFDIYYRIRRDDILSRQRYVLFRTITACCLFVVIVTTVQTYYLIKDKPYIIGFLLAMTILGIFNYIYLQYHKNTKAAYFTIILIAFFSIHLLTYISGGIQASNMFYYGALILISFTLLGIRAGLLISFLITLNLIYFFYITENTHLISNILFIQDGISGVNIDFLITGLLSMAAIAALSNYIEISKKEVIKDITDKKDEIEFKNIELQKLSIVASKTDNAVIITDMEGNTEWINEGFTRFTGYTLDEIKGKSPDELLNGKMTDMDSIEQRNETLLTKRYYSGEILLYHKNGNTFWTHTAITPIISEHGEVEKYVCIATDISERKQYERKLQEYLQNLENTNKELQQFAYVVSHDLKAPLRAINNLTSWIEEDLSENINPDVTENFGTLRGRVARMENLINGILEYSRLNNSHQLEEISVRNIVIDTLDLIGHPSGFKIELQDNLPSVIAEKIKLQQVFSNLMSNAIKYNDKEQGYIGITFKDMGNEWEFTIKDNGRGIDKKYHSKIFVIFQTLHSRDEYESTGVGLAIVKKIIEQYGGTIRCESEEGNGARFIFTWPKKILLAGENTTLDEDKKERKAVA